MNYRKSLLSILFGLLISNSLLMALEVSLSFTGARGDKISLFQDRLEGSNMYGFGVEASTLYFKTGGRYRWYAQENADDGASDVMALDNSKLSLMRQMVIDTSGRGILINGDDRDSWITFHDPDNVIYSMGIDYSDGRKFKINYGGSVGERNHLTMSTSGNVGIGTTSPNNKLDVNGTMRAKEVIVETNWSDFVFENDYKLRPLAEVSTFISEHGHLPDVPSAQTVQTQGLSVGESQKIMMQKIEELMLYTLQQEKLIKQLLAANEEQSKLKASMFETLAEMKTEIELLKSN